MPRTLLSEPEGYELLRRYEIPIPAYAVVHTAEEAVQEAGKIGFPLVAKVISPQVVHKSDAGGVVNGIRSAPEAGEAFLAITGRVRAVYPDAEIRGIILEKQQAEGLELIVGGKTDPSFGKIMTIGMGGTLVELIRDVSIRLLPLTDGQMRSMIRSLRGYPLIAGFRNSTPRDPRPRRGRTIRAQPGDRTFGVGAMVRPLRGRVRFDPWSVGCSSLRLLTLVPYGDALRRPSVLDKDAASYFPPPIGRQLRGY